MFNFTGEKLLFKPNEAAVKQIKGTTITQTSKYFPCCLKITSRSSQQ